MNSRLSAVRLIWELALPPLYAHAGALRAVGLNWPMDRTTAPGSPPCHLNWTGVHGGGSMSARDGMNHGLSVEAINAASSLRSPVRGSVLSDGRWPTGLANRDAQDFGRGHATRNRAGGPVFVDRLLLDGGKIAEQNLFEQRIAQQRVSFRQYLTSNQFQAGIGQVRHLCVADDDDHLIAKTVLVLFE
jgi:hypothetical protein